MVTGQPAAGRRVSIRNSLRLRFPLLIAVLSVEVFAVFLWLAFREVEASHIRAGGQRAQSAADQITGLFERPAQQGLDQLRALASDDTVKRLLQDPNDQTREAARQRFEGLKAASPRVIELWSHDGTCLLSVALPGTARNATSLPVSSSMPATLGVSLQQAGEDDVVLSDAVAETPPYASAPGAPMRAGRVLVRSVLSINPPGIITQLVGADAIVLLGDRTGGTWTDLVRIASAPAVDLSTRGVREYRNDRDEPRLGALSMVRQTPLAVWVEFPRGAIVAPARQFLARMTALAIGLVFAVGALVAMLTGRITTPLNTLVQATTQIANGDYSRRVSIPRADEIGQLGDAFNSMAADIQSAYGALKENYDQTQFALEAAQMGIWEIDLTTNGVTWSDSLVSVFGLAPHTAPRDMAAFFDLVHPDDRGAVRTALTDAVKHGRREYSMRFRTILADHSVRSLDARARLFYDERGVATRVLGVALDVTGRTALEEQLRQAQKLEAIGQLAGGVAHDFNNLLTAIMGFSELLSDGLDAEDPRREHIAEIRQAGERGVGLTRQLLAFSRKQLLEPTIVNLNSLVTDTSQMLRRLIGEDVQYVTKLSPQLATVLADRSQLEQVVINLVLNARDSMPDGGLLSIETANVEFDDNYVLGHTTVRPGSYVMLTVSDTGLGMSAETQRRIFEPFFTTKERGRGTGLGLAMVYGIVTQSGGYIWVYSEQGRGTAFKVYLPRADAYEQPERPPAAVQMRLNGSETVLVAEDDSSIRSLSRRILMKAGYRVLDAADPAAAEAVFTDAVELLITDVIMPGANGPALYQTLRARKPTLKVLYMSGYTGEAMVEGRKLGPDAAFLQKPFTPEGLQRKVREVLDAEERL